MMKTSYSLGAALVGIFCSAPAGAATVDSITGIVSDAASKAPLGQVSVTSEGVATTTDATGFFRLLLPLTTAISPESSQGSPLARWNANDASISWSGFSGSVSIRVQDVRGQVVGQYTSEQNSTSTGVSLQGLPSGLLIATLKAGNRFEVLKFFHSGSRAQLSQNPSSSGLVALGRALATSKSHSVVFSKTGYASATVVVAAGTQAPLAVGLSANASTGAISLFDGKTLADWTAAPPADFKVNTVDQAIQLSGAGRGVLYTTAMYLHYRVIYSVRHIFTGADHYSCVLIFGQNNKADALAGYQLGLPSSHHWDYRPGKTASGDGWITTFNSPSINRANWTQCEVLVNTRAGTASAAVAQPPGTKATKILTFSDPSVKTYNPSSFGLQSHNAGLEDEYKDITIEVDPAVDSLITTR
jgi:hypothetical protein